MPRATQGASPQKQCAELASQDTKELEERSERWKEHYVDVAEQLPLELMRIYTLLRQLDEGVEGASC